MSQILPRRCLRNTETTDRGTDNGNFPLLHYAERVRVRTLPIAARRLARRLALPAATALFIAEQAGFPTGDER